MSIWTENLLVLCNQQVKQRLMDEAKRVAQARSAALWQRTDAELLALEQTTESVKLGKTRAICVAWHEAQADGSHLILVQVWGKGFVWGSWLFAAEGFRFEPDARVPLTEAELHELNL